MVELSRVTGTIAAPAEQIWPVLADFAHPQRIAKSIEGCEVSGEGVGCVRVVRARGMVIHERLEVLDSGAWRLCYRALEAGDMPAAGVVSYLATVTLRPRSETVTDIEWRGEGEIEGPIEPISAHFDALYRRAIASVGDEVRAAAR